MKILVGNNRMANPGGSETYTYALIAELVRQGHNVECITLQRGMVSRYIDDLGVPVHSSPIRAKFDLALLSHGSSIRLARNIKAFKVQTCHGVYPPLEQPIKGMDGYVSISKEVALHLSKRGFTSEIIHNGIDCRRFRSKNPINKELKVVLSLSHSDKLNKLLKGVCKVKNVEFLINNKYHNPIWEVEDQINKADLIVSLGRGAYEAMACGRNVLIYDNRAYAKTGAIGDGIVTDQNISDFLENNCSGRYSNILFGGWGLVTEFGKYNSNQGKKLRKFALEHLNIEKQVEKYIKLVR